jgi:hypothetical protein
MASAPSAMAVLDMDYSQAGKESFFKTPCLLEGKQGFLFPNHGSANNE